MSAPAVHLHPDAVRWVAERGGALTLRAWPRHGCCGGTAHLPVVEMGEPQGSAGWEVRILEGVTVYLDPALAGQQGPLTVQAEGLLGWRWLFVEDAGAGG